MTEKMTYDKSNMSAGNGAPERPDQGPVEAFSTHTRIAPAPARRTIGLDH